MTTTSRRVTGLLAVALTAGGLAACNTQSVGSEPIGQLVATASEADGEWVTEVDSDVLIVTPWELELFRKTLPAEALPELDEVDLSTHALVLGSYPRCTETSAVFADTVDDERTIVRFAVVRDPTPDVCDWSPTVINAWAVPHDLTGDRAPIALSRSHAPEKSPDPQPVGELVESVGEGDAASAEIDALRDSHGPLVSSESEFIALSDDLASLEPFADSAGDAGPLSDVDMNSHALVLVVFDKCSEQSQVYTDTERDPTLLWAELTTEEIDCAWSPRTLDIWQVPIAEISERFEYGQYLSLPRFSRD